MMKPTVHKVKNVRGRIVGYFASFHQISRQGYRTETPAEAVTECEAAVVVALRNLAQGTLINRWNGHLYVVSPDSNGWRTWCELFSQMNYYSGQGGTRDEAEYSIIHHIAQVTWTHDTDDIAFLALVPEKMQDDLASYFRWQRDYKRLKTAGYSDQDAHAIACGMKKEVA